MYVRSCSYVYYSLDHVCLQHKPAKFELLYVTLVDYIVLCFSEYKKRKKNKSVHQARLLHVGQNVRGASGGRKKKLFFTTFSGISFINILSFFCHCCYYYFSNLFLCPSHTQSRPLHGLTRTSFVQHASWLTILPLWSPHLPRSCPQYTSAGQILFTCPVTASQSVHSPFRANAVRPNSFFRPFSTHTNTKVFMKS